MKKKKSPKRMLATSFISCLVVGLLIAGSVSAQIDQKFLDAWDVVKAKVESLLPSSDKLLSVAELQARDSEVLGGTGETASVRNVTGLFDLTLKDSDSSENDIKYVQRQISGTLGTASSTFLSIQNTTGHDVYVESAGIRLFTNASSTTRFGMGTSSIVSPAYNATWATGVAKQIFGAVVATSTGDSAGFIATSTNGSSYALVNETGTVTIAQNPWVVVKPNEYIVGFMQSQNLQWAVTSTSDRGFSTNSFYLLNVREIATST